MTAKKLGTGALQMPAGGTEREKILAIQDFIISDEMHLSQQYMKLSEFSTIGDQRTYGLQWQIVIRSSKTTQWFLAWSRHRQPSVLQGAI